MSEGNGGATRPAAVAADTGRAPRRRHRRLTSHGSASRSGRAGDRARRRADARLQARGRGALRARCLHGRARRSRSDRAREAPLRARRPASGWSSSSASAGPDGARACTGPRVESCSSAFSARPVEVEVPCNYDLELAATKYFHSVEDGEIPLAFHINGSVYYQAMTGGCRSSRSPGTRSADYRWPSRSGSEMIDAYYPHRGWVPARAETLEGCDASKARAGACPPSTRRWRSCSGARGRGTADGEPSRSWSARCSTRATPSTPTRRGRPRTRRRPRSGSSTRRRYAESQPAAPLLRLECVLVRGPEARVAAARSASCSPPASATGRVERGSSWAGRDRRAARRRRAASFASSRATRGPGPLEGRVRMRAETLGARLVRVKLCVHNTTELEEAPEEMGRGEALAGSLISTHVGATGEDGRFISPLERDGAAGEAVTGSENVNTWPVLAGERGRRGPRRGDRSSQTIRGSRPRASATCSTTPRSRRRCCCT